VTSYRLPGTQVTSAWLTLTTWCRLCFHGRATGILYATKWPPTNKQTDRGQALLIVCLMSPGGRKEVCPYEVYMWQLERSADVCWRQITLHCPPVTHSVDGECRMASEGSEVVLRYPTAWNQLLSSDFTAHCADRAGRTNYAAAATNAGATRDVTKFSDSQLHYVVVRMKTILLQIRHMSDFLKKMIVMTISTIPQEK